MVTSLVPCSYRCLPLLPASKLESYRLSNIIITFVFGYRLQSVLKGIFSFQLFAEVLLVRALRKCLWYDMAQSTIFENILGVVYPVVKAVVKLKGWELPLGGRLYLSFILSHSVHCSRNYRTTSCNPNYLTFQKMLLESREEGISNDWSLKITSKHIFDPPRYLHLLGSHQRQLSPVTIKVCRDPVSKFVNSLSSRFNPWFEFPILPSFRYTLRHVIVFLLTEYLPPEFKLFNLFDDGKSFKRFKYFVRQLLSEAYPHILEPSSLFHYVRYVSCGTWLCWFFILLSHFGFLHLSTHYVYQSQCLVDILLQMLSLRLTKLTLRNSVFELFDIERILFKQIVAVLGIVQKHLSQYVCQVRVEVLLALAYSLQLLFQTLSTRHLTISFRLQYQTQYITITV